MKTTTQGVIIIQNEQGEVTHMILKDEKTHHNLIYRCALEGFEELQNLFEKVTYN